MSTKAPEKMENTKRRAYVLRVEADELVTMLERLADASFDVGRYLGYEDGRDG